MSTDLFTDPRAPAAPVHRLSNGRYEVLISDTGCGQSSWNGLALSRWRNDPVQDDLGSILYLRDLDQARFWSMGYQPTRVPTSRYRTECAGGHFVLEREDDGIEARLEVGVAVGADLERRRLRLVNRSRRARRMEVTSYLEVVLFYADADAAHPAFAKLFVQAERDAARGALLAHRRPRAAHEAWPWMVHALIGAEPVGWETGRMRFLGSGGSPARPTAMLGADPLTGTVGNLLDPIFSLRTILELPPDVVVELEFVTGVGRDRHAALRLVNGSSRGVTETPKSQGIPSPEAPIIGERDGLRVFNGYGGFSRDGREYLIRMPWEGDAPRRPPARRGRCAALVAPGAYGMWAAHPVLG